MIQEDFLQFSDDTLIYILQNENEFEDSIIKKARGAWSTRYNDDSNKKESFLRYEELLENVSSRLKSNTSHFEVEEYLIGEGMGKALLKN